MKKLNVVHFLIAFILVGSIYTLAKKFYLQPSVNDGEKAPDFTAVSHENFGFKLSDLDGKYILLDFWGSWCGPCIAEAPSLAALYGKYATAKFEEADGFTIVSVAVEKDKQRWAAAIEHLGLIWPHQAIDPVSNFRFFDSPIAKDYGVKQLPTKFLIDGDRKIIAVDMPIEEIDRFLAERVEK